MNLFGLHTNHRQKGFSLIVDIIYFPQISLFKSNSLPSITQNVQKMKRKKHHELCDSWICLAKVMCISMCWTLQNLVQPFFGDDWTLSRKFWHVVKASLTSPKIE